MEEEGARSHEAVELHDLPVGDDDPVLSLERADDPLEEIVDVVGEVALPVARDRRVGSLDVAARRGRALRDPGHDAVEVPLELQEVVQARDPLPGAAVQRLVELVRDALLEELLEVLVLDRRRLRLERETVAQGGELLELGDAVRRGEEHDEVHGDGTSVLIRLPFVDDREE
ncbi:hypothetical protein HY251_18800, partial [bacterium]|nr:hypothetical protein [bacterium]